MYLDVSVVSVKLRRVRSRYNINTTMCLLWILRTMNMTLLGLRTRDVAGSSSVNVQRIPTSSHIKLARVRWHEYPFKHSGLVFLRFILAKRATTDQSDTAFPVGEQGAAWCTLGILNFRRSQQIEYLIFEHVQMFLCIFNKKWQPLCVRA